MVTCDTCNDEQRVPWMIEGDPNCYMEPDSEGMIPCPDCTHDVETCLDDHEEPIAGPTTRLRRRIRADVQYARSLWRDRNSSAIAAYVYAHRNVLDDEPQLRGLIDHELRAQIDAVRTPLGWRKIDLRWSLTNAWRAVRGRDPLPLPYEVITDVMVSQQGEFDRTRNLLMILAERRRRVIDRR